jgi:hypothetical protein
MTPTDIKPSARLVRAAQAEREDLKRQRERLTEVRDKTAESLSEIERALAGLDEREILLSRLVPANAQPRARKPDEAPRDAAQEACETLRGPAIREAAVRTLARSRHGEAMHYREWFELLTREGYDVAGKNPIAVFLTQLSRSPAVRKSTQAGVYELDREAPQRLGRELERLQGELRELTTYTSRTADLSRIRARREQLTSDIARAERALDEARRVLDPDATDASPPAERLVAAG